MQNFTTLGQPLLGEKFVWVVVVGGTKGQFFILTLFPFSIFFFIYSYNKSIQSYLPLFSSDPQKIILS